MTISLIIEMHSVSRLFTFAARFFTVCSLLFLNTTMWMWIDGFVIDKSSKMRLFPFKKVTVPEDPVGNWPAADRGEGIPKLFQHTAPKSPRCLPSSPGRPRTWSQPPRRLFPVSVSEEMDAVRR